MPFERELIVLSLPFKSGKKDYQWFNTFFFFFIGQEPTMWPAITVYKLWSAHAQYCLNVFSHKIIFCSTCLIGLVRDYIKPLKFTTKPRLREVSQTSGGIVLFSCWYSFHLWAFGNFSRMKFVIYIFKVRLGGEIC